MKDRITTPLIIVLMACITAALDSISPIIAITFLVGLLIATVIAFINKHLEDRHE